MKINDLIDLAKQAPENSTKATKSINDVHRFLRLFKIKDGAHKIRRKVLYDAFNMWQPGLLFEKDFYKQAARFFELQSGGQGDQKYYLINYKPLELLNRVDNFMRG